MNKGYKQLVLTMARICGRKSKVIAKLLDAKKKREEIERMFKDEKA